MAKLITGKIKYKAYRAYRNDTSSGLNPLDIIDYDDDIYIGNFDLVDKKQLTEWTLPFSTDKKFYYFNTDTEPTYAGYTKKINYGLGNVMTVFGYNDIRLEPFYDSKSDRPASSHNDKYGKCFPSGTIGDNTFGKVMVPYKPYYGASVIKPFKLIQNAINNGTAVINGIHAQKEEFEEDGKKFLKVNGTEGGSGTKETAYASRGFNIVDKDGNSIYSLAGTMLHQFGSSGAYKLSVNSQNQIHYSYKKDGVGLEGDITIPMATYAFRDEETQQPNSIAIRVDNTNGTNPIIYGFMIDKNKDVWIVCYSCIGKYSGGLNARMCNMFIRVKDCPYNVVYDFNDKEVQGDYKLHGIKSCEYFSEEEGQLVNDIFYHMLGIGGGGPEIPDANNPFEGHTQNDNKGGKGTFEDHRDVDGTMGGNNIAPLFSGSWQRVYIVESGDLENLSRTVSNLKKYKYENWTGGVYSTFYNEASKNMESNIMSIVALPLDVKKELGLTDDQVFAVGGHPVCLTGNIDYMADPGDSSGWSKVAGLFNPFLTIETPLKCSEDGGTVLKRYYDNFLDYSPHTCMYIYIPFIGINKVFINDLYDKSLSLKWNFNASNGDFAVDLLADGDIQQHFNGNCAYQLRVNSVDNSQGISSAITRTALATAGAGMVAGGLVNVAGVANNALNTGATMAAAHSAGKLGTFGTYAGTSIAGTEVGMSKVARGAGMAGATFIGGGDTGSATMGNMPLSGSVGFLDSMNVYIKIVRPNTSIPEYFNNMVGYKCNFATTLGSLTDDSLCSVSDCYLKTTLSYEEQVELENILKGGFIV